MPIRRRIFTLVFAAILALVVAVLPANAGGGNNVVIVENATNGTTMVDASTQVIPVPMDSVTSGNVAIAINSDCVGCHSSDPTLSRDHELDARLDALSNELIQVVTAGLEQSGDDTTVLQDNVDVGSATPGS